MRLLRFTTWLKLASIVVRWHEEENIKGRHEDEDRGQREADTENCIEEREKIAKERLRLLNENAKVWMKKNERMRERETEWYCFEPAVFSLNGVDSLQAWELGMKLKDCRIIGRHVRHRDFFRELLFFLEPKRIERTLCTKMKNLGKEIVISQGLRQASSCKGTSNLPRFLCPRRVRFLVYFIVALFLSFCWVSRGMLAYIIVHRDSKIYSREIFIN